MTYDYGFLKDVILPLFAIIISVIAIFFSGITWQRARPIEKKGYESSILIRIFDLLDSDDMKLKKERIAHEYWRLKEENKRSIDTRIIFGGEIKKYADRLRESFNKASMLYERELLDKEMFRTYYERSMIIYWKMLRDDIANDQTSQNPFIAKRFEDVVKEFIGNWNKNHLNEPEPEPYRPSDFVPRTIELS